MCLNVVQTIITCSGLAATLLLANWYLQNDQLTVGDFVMFNSYILGVYNPLGQLGRLWKQIKKGMVDVEEVLNLL